MNRVTCPVCEGRRLKVESLHFKIAGKNISELASMELIELKSLVDSLKDKLDAGKEGLQERFCVRSAAASVFCWRWG